MKNHELSMDPTLRLLAACTPLDPDPGGTTAILQAVAPIQNWNALLEEAELQGMAPLLHRALKTAGLTLEDEIRLKLKGMVLRHRLANQVRRQVLIDILAKADAANLQPVLVKGAALADLVYPDPALRPMRDMDMLLSAAQLQPMQQLLLEMGFAETHPGELFTHHRHLPTLTKTVDGFKIGIEVHHSLFSVGIGQHWGSMDELISPLNEYQLAGTSLTARCLGPEDMLVQLCSHFNRSGGEYEPLRMMWVADLLAFLAAFSARLNWPLLKTSQPQVLSTLAQVHQLTPLPAGLATQLALESYPQPAGVGQPYQGWPNISIEQIKKAGRGQFLRRTFQPSEWWLALYYGRSGPFWLWRSRAEHLLRILQRASQHLLLARNAKITPTTLGAKK
jgi:hypothetical protein